MNTKEKTRVQLINQNKILRVRIQEYERLEDTHKELRKTVIDSNRRLQENTQSLYIAQQKLKAEAAETAKLTKAVEQSSSVIMITDTKGKIEYVNPKLRHVTGYSVEEIIGKNPRILKSGKTSSGVYTELWDHITSGKEWYGELCNKKKNGELYLESVSISPIRNSKDEITHILKVSDDITERKKAEKTIHQMAYYDALTGLPNRILFSDRLGQSLEHARRTKKAQAVMFIDLDNFKLINDTMGHAMGDNLLKSVAEELKNSVRAGDTVSRAGGDEFTVLITSLNCEKDVEMIAEKIISAFRKPFVFGGHELNVTTSIGIAIYPTDGKDEEILLRNADTAMYHAKEQGKNNYKRYDNSLHEKVTKKLLIDTKLRTALDKEQFVLYYQPQIDIYTREVIGMEALLRWQHPELGLVPPMDFIMNAEGSGMIVPISEWVLFTACSQVKTWQDAGFVPVGVSVNLSSQTFIREDLLKVIEQVIKATGIAPELLELEITEGTVMQKVESTVYKLQQLRKLGVQISIDDFGTGYSSLSYLKKFPLHTLKVDRSFITDIINDNDSASIALAIIAMAKKLRLKVIAEGVETEEQLSLLRENQCDIVQGYLISRPVPVEEFERFLTKRNQRGSI